MAMLAKYMMMAILLKSAAKPPVLHLTGETRACHGRFDLTAKRLSWKSTWSLCVDQPVRVIAQDANRWVFQIKPAKTCPFEVLETINITKRDGLPASAYPLYEVNGFKTATGYREHPQATDLSCNMQ